MKVGFNKAYANKVSKAKFIEDHKHYAGVDLGQAWEDLQEKKEAEPKKTESAKATADK